MGLKYNSQSVIYLHNFKNGVHTIPGTPYSAEYIQIIDYHSVVHKVPIPYLVSLYFDNYNCIDKHKHVIQYKLVSS